MTQPNFASKQKNNPGRIRRIRIEKLFGYLTYDLEPRAELGRLAILYGDNGSGKTTILRLLFSLLVSRRIPGTKSFLARTPFRSFEITFEDGSLVLAEKAPGQLVGSYNIHIARPGQENSVFKLVAEQDHTIRDKENKIVPSLMQALQSFGVGLYFLPDDRRVRTTFDEPEEEPLQHIQAPRMSDQATDAVAQRESHHLNVAPVLRKLETWLRRSVLAGSNTGEENTTSIYLRVAQQLATSITGAAEAEREESLIRRMVSLGEATKIHATLGLMSPFPAEDFIAQYQLASADAKRGMAIVLKPYLDGVEARLRALESVREIISTYTETLNSFLRWKRIDVSLRNGAVVQDSFGNSLSPNLLSSGERQLLLLFTNTVLARDSASLFLIDEPELSLNVKWQRTLVEALLRCAKGSRIQYILASHSLELITQHKHSAIPLIPKEP